jgi:hypothetical protein
LTSISFVVDVISIAVIIPEIVIILITTEVNDNLRALYLLRLLRLTRVVRLLDRGILGSNPLSSPLSMLFVKFANTAVAYLLQIVYTLAMLINFLGCIWWLLAVVQVRLLIT